MNYMEFAQEVISHYPITNPEIEFIRHNENITFKVVDTPRGKSYLLRIHKPITQGLFGIQHSYEGLQSEVQLLSSMSQNNELKVQKPVCNNMGEFVTKYKSSELGECYATVLEWIDGKMLSLKDPVSEDIAFSIGEKLAVLHQLFSQFKPSESFVRPKYDIERIDASIGELAYGIEMELYSREDFDIMCKVLSAIKERLIELEKKNHGYGIIHADVLSGNIILSDGQASFIDFCLCGFGYYLFDLASAATIFDEKNLRDAVIKGYASKTDFSFDQLRDLEILVFMDIFVSYPFFIRDNSKNKWIKDQASKLCATACKDFLEGKEVFYSL